MNSQNSVGCDKNKVISSLYFEIQSSDDFGRYLVAKEDIPEKTVILCEAPFLYGPTDDKDLETDVVSLYCLSCCKLLYPADSVDDKDNPDITSEDLYHCSKCGWPVCDRFCEAAPVHSDHECRFFTSTNYQRSNYPPPHQWLMYKSVILLRLLLLIQRDRHEAWEEFLEKLEHHTDMRENKPNCIRADEIVLENLEYFTAGLASKRSSVSKKSAKKKYCLPFLDDEILLKRLIGTFNVNAFCANNDVTKRIARCMFKSASLFAHSCAPNCSWTIEVSLKDDQRKRKSKNGHNASISSPVRITPQIQVYTAVPVLKGEMITIPYSTRNLFFGTLKRQLHMESVGHFTCKCRRCMDPTELATFMSAVRCFRCENGFLVSTDPSNEESKWMCVSNIQVNSESDGHSHMNGTSSASSSCDYRCSVGKVVYFVSNIQDHIDRIRSVDLNWYDEQEKLQHLFEKYYDKDLHKNHYLLHEISTRLVELFEENLSDEMSAGKRLEKNCILPGRFLFHVKYMMNIANLILPGYNNHQDQLKYYLEEAESLMPNKAPSRN